MRLETDPKDPDRIVLVDEPRHCPYCASEDNVWPMAMTPHVEELLCIECARRYALVHTAYLDTKSGREFPVGTIIGRKDETSYITDPDRLRGAFDEYVRGGGIVRGKGAVAT